MFTKQHYLVISKLINSLTDNKGRIDRDNLVEHFADYFGKDNPEFDRDKFYKACYIKEK